MLEDLKKCRTIKEIYQTLPQDWDEKAALIVLLMWVLLPLLMLPMFYIYPGDVASISMVFGILIQTMGSLTLLFVAIHLFGSLQTKTCRFVDSVKKAPWQFILLLMLLWALIASVLSNNVYMSIWGNDRLHEGFYTYCSYAAAFYAATLLHEKRKEFIIKIFIWTSFVFCIVFLAKFVHVGFVDKYIFASEVSYYNDTNIFGYYLTMSILILAGIAAGKSEKNRILYSLILGFEIYVLIMNNALGSFLAVLVAMLIIIPLNWLYKRKFSWQYLIPLIIFIMTCALYYGITRLSGGADSISSNFNTLFSDVTKISNGAVDAGNAGSGRYAIWMRSFQIAKDRPWFGYGPEQTFEAYMKGGVRHYRPHNEILQHMVFLGIPAAVLYVVALIWLFIHQLKKISRLRRTTILSAFGVVAYFISSMFGNTVPWTAVFFFIFLAFASDQTEQSGFAAIAAYGSTDSSTANSVISVSD